MAANMVNRPAEEGAVREFLDAAASAPSALLIDGDPGIGKTTLWSAACEWARVRGFQVLSARVAAAEPVSAYTALADLLNELDPAMWADLPAPQRVAVDQVLLRESAGRAATDQRAVTAALLSIVDLLSHDKPVLLAIDDLQWLDPSSMHVVAFAARRLTGPVGFLGAVRTERYDDDGATADWLQFPRPDAVHRIQLQPLSIGALGTVVTEAIGRTLPRQAIARIHATCGGNPFYAIELARALDGQVPGIEAALPGNLADLVRARIGSVGADVHNVLLAASCLTTPTVELVSNATTTDVDRLVDLLEDAETKGIIAIEGNRVNFAHPLLARGVYTEATQAQRRSMHRRLASVVDEPELRARHLALAATRHDPDTLEALDEAADSAHRRGAPAAAADLLDLAIGLGGDTPERRIRLAAHCFDGGEPARAKALLEHVIDNMPSGPLRAKAQHALAIVRFTDDGFSEAVQLLERSLREDDPDPAMRVQLLTALSHALYNTGEPVGAWSRAEEAVTHAEELGVPGLLSQALGVRAMLHFLRGDGVDEASLTRSLELEDPESPMPAALRPSVEHALLLGWTGELDPAHERMQMIARRCIERGEEGDLIFIYFQVALNRIWRGDFAAARRVAADTDEVARHLGGEFPAMLSLVIRAWLAAYDGNEDDARTIIADAIEASRRSGTTWHEEWSLTALGFLETSLGNHGAALQTLEPMLSRFGPASSTEIFAAAFLPDAIEALIELGRVDDAEPLVGVLEKNGRQRDRTWMRAVGARCRGMVAAARGDMETAVAAVQSAMSEHDQLPMPFERARTQLLLGQLARRRRQKDAAALAVRDALTAFEELGTPLWAKRARAEQTRVETTSQTTDGLTMAEQRVAELAASGMTNRDVAGALFISPKTVEATLARVYRKLGIRSRAELGRRMGSG